MRNWSRLLAGLSYIFFFVPCPLQIDETPDFESDRHGRQESVLESEWPAVAPEREKMKELERFAEFGRLSSGIFHDLINPLTAVKLNLAELEESAKALTRAKICLESSLKAATQMENFIHTVQKQIGHGETKTIFSLNEEIEDVVNLLDFKIRRKNTSVKLCLKENIRYYGEVMKFRQVISNLISNAVDACNNDSKDNKVVIVLKSRDNCAYIKIKDCGCGIDPTIRKRIFDPFFSTKPPGEGIGLGLSTVKEVVENNFSGWIRISSTEGKGSIFRVYLPLGNEISEFQLSPRHA